MITYSLAEFLGQGFLSLWAPRWIPIRIIVNNTTKNIGVPIPLQFQYKHTQFRDLSDSLKVRSRKQISTQVPQIQIVLMAT